MSALLAVPVEKACRVNYSALALPGQGFRKSLGKLSDELLAQVIQLIGQFTTAGLLSQEKGQHCFLIDS